MRGKEGGRERERVRTRGRHKLSRPRTVSIWSDTASTRSASVRPLPWRSGQLRRQYTRYRERERRVSFSLSLPPAPLSLSRSLPRTFTRAPHLSKLAAAVLRVSAVRCFAPEPRGGAIGAIEQRSMQFLPRRRVMQILEGESNDFSTF